MSFPRTALVVGGTGPTGVPLVGMLLDEGIEVTIFHSGSHEVEFLRAVNHLHGDARDRVQIESVLGSREWDVAVCTSGRLRLLSEKLRGQVGRLVAVTGSPVYSGSMRVIPEGRLHLPLPENASCQSDAAGYAGRIAAGEDVVRESHARGDYEGVIVRYPGIYGPRAPLNNEWVVVQHCVDQRSFMVVPDGGTTYFHRAFTENAARLLLLAATHPDAAGEAFNAGDEAVMSAAEIVEIIADELGASLVVESVPAALCRGLFPLADRATQILDINKARTILGYRDVLDVEAATRLTARWIRDNTPDPNDPRAGGPPTVRYDHEDWLRERWHAVMRTFETNKSLKP